MVCPGAFARAATTYTYTGLPYQAQTIVDSLFIPGMYDTSMMISLSFTLSVPIGPNGAFGLTLLNQNDPNLLSFSASDGRNTFFIHSGHAL